MTDGWRAPSERKRTLEYGPLATKIALVVITTWVLKTFVEGGFHLLATRATASVECKKVNGSWRWWGECK